MEINETARQLSDKINLIDALRTSGNREERARTASELSGLTTIARDYLTTTLAEYQRYENKIAQLTEVIKRQEDMLKTNTFPKEQQIEQRVRIKEAIRLLVPLVAESKAQLPQKKTPEERPVESKTEPIDALEQAFADYHESIQEHHEENKKEGKLENLKGTETSIVKGIKNGMGITWLEAKKVFNTNFRKSKNTKGYEFRG